MSVLQTPGKRSPDNALRVKLGGLKPGFLSSAEHIALSAKWLFCSMMTIMTEQSSGIVPPEVMIEPCDLEQARKLGVAPGINIAPGEDDDGWIVPPPVRLSDGSRIQLYKDGEALHAAYEAIRQAKQRICLESYIFASDATGRAFADLLSAKAREGVQTYVIYDSFGSMSSDRRMFQDMRRAGVRIQAFHPIRPWECRFSWRPFNRDHRKLLVVDDHIAGLGGLNVGSEYAGSWVVSLGSADCEAWRDNGMGIIGPAARIFLRAFIRMWRYIGTGGRIAKAELVENVQGYDQPSLEGEDVIPPDQLGVIASVPSAHAPLPQFFHRLMSGARKKIELTMAYFAPTDEMINSLCDAARRGVRVRLMLPERCDVHLLVLAARSFYDRLMDAGVEIYERRHAVLHAKSLVIDSELTILGSANLDYRSIEYNCEISAIVRSREFGEQMSMLFENDVNFAKRINPDLWRHRPFLDRLGQWATNRARYLL